MAHTIKERDGSTRTTVLTADANRATQLTILSVAGDATKGAEIYVRESIAANGDIVWRWLRREPPAK